VIWVLQNQIPINNTPNMNYGGCKLIQVIEPFLDIVNQHTFDGYKLKTKKLSPISFMFKTFYWRQKLILIFFLESSTVILIPLIVLNVKKIAKPLMLASKNLTILKLN